MKTTLKQSLHDDVTELAERFDPDPAHAEQVTRLALIIFDELQTLHTIGARGRMLLEVSAMLHDIGWSRPETKGHNKHSRDMILESELHGLNDTDRLICALVARYHRKAEPDAARHRRFASLDVRDRGVVEWLSGILRVADGLDRSHASATSGVRCEIGPETILFHLDGTDIGDEDLSGARRKSALLERKAGRRIEYRPC